MRQFCGTSIFLLLAAGVLAGYRQALLAWFGFEPLRAGDWRAIWHAVEGGAAFATPYQLAWLALHPAALLLLLLALPAARRTADPLSRGIGRLWRSCRGASPSASSAGRPLGAPEATVEGGVRAPVDRALPQRAAAPLWDGGSVRPHADGAAASAPCPASPAPPGPVLRSEPGPAEPGPGRDGPLAAGNRAASAPESGSGRSPVLAAVLAARGFGHAGPGRLLGPLSRTLLPEGTPDELELFVGGADGTLYLFALCHGAVDRRSVVAAAGLAYWLEELLEPLLPAGAGRPSPRSPSSPRQATGADLVTWLLSEDLPAETDLEQPAREHDVLLAGGRQGLRSLPRAGRPLPDGLWRAVAELLPVG
ncbi:hypothetical protein SAMN06265365_110114 [Tistlia consotensis]|uniref:Uncharacterized protein n=2 Tax=Tistlia TaxID=1321364 RepID=A0A1Y6BY25_9PROT|nr:hypothetical protein [Tistlia consotensis]SMF26943.1 hypothetical protein SAMN05428998_10942 [Tistlia consotensis USBA 355]SNR66667.1 hypothetical protein SAMN06265365_110114 [Tistlia consotensis]